MNVVVVASLLVVVLCATAPVAVFGNGPSFRAKYYSSTENARLSGHSFEVASRVSRVTCAMLCLRTDGCGSFNYGGTGGVCQLNGEIKGDFPADFRSDPDFSYFDGGDTGLAVTTTVAIQTTSYQMSTFADPTAPPTTTETEPEPTPSLNAPVVRCPDTAGTFTYNTMTEATLFWDPLPSANDEEDGYIGYTSVRCKDNTGRTIQHRHTSLPTGTNITVTCSVTDSDGNKGQCQYGFVVVDCPCCEPLGMESGEIRDEQITAGSVMDGDYEQYGPQHARLNGAGWCADLPKWIQVDYNKTVDIYGVLIQKHNITGSISSFNIMYSDDGELWTTLTNNDGSNRVLFAWDINLAPGGAPITFQTPLRTAIRTRFIRLKAVQTSRPACLRFELIGCKLHE